MCRQNGYVQKKANGSINIGGIETCSSYGCPICANANARAREQEILQCLINANEKGLYAYHFTFSQKHSSKCMLKPELERHVQYRGAFFDGINKMAGIHFEGRITVVGIDFIHGWHPHSHIIIFSNIPLSDEQQFRLKKRWVKKTQGTANQGNGLKIQLIENNFEDFYKIAKYLAYQLVYTTEELLSHDKYEARYREYIEAIYKKHIIMINEKTRKALNVPVPEQSKNKSHSEYVIFEQSFFKQMIEYNLLYELKRAARTFWGNDLIEHMRLEVDYHVKSKLLNKVILHDAKAQKLYKALALSQATTLRQ